MGIASSIANKLRGHNCEKLVRYTAQEVIFTGFSGEAAGYKINLGNFSNNVKRTNSVSETMKALDNQQYILCMQAHDSSASPELRKKCLEARVMCTIGLSHFQALVALQEPSKPLRSEIREWIKNMNALTLKCMESFLPSVDSVCNSPTVSETEGICNRLYMRRDRKYVKREKAGYEETVREREYSQEYLPKQRTIKKEASKQITIEQIMRYQEIDEEDLAKAVEILQQQEN